MTKTEQMTERDYVEAVAATLERLQIKPEDLFGYVEGLRARYKACVDTLLYMALDRFEDPADVVARAVLEELGIELEGNVSHETNSQE